MAEAFNRVAWVDSLRPGAVVWAARWGWAEPDVESATVAKVQAGEVVLARRGGLAFQCLKRVPLGCVHPSPAAALEALARGIEEAAGRLEAQADVLRTQSAAAREAALAQEDAP